MVYKIFSVYESCLNRMQMESQFKYAILECKFYSKTYLFKVNGKFGNSILYFAMLTACKLSSQCQQRRHRENIERQRK